MNLVCGCNTCTKSGDAAQSTCVSRVRPFKGFSQVFFVVRLWRISVDLTMIRKSHSGEAVSVAHEDSRMRASGSSFAFVRRRTLAANM